MLTNLNTIFTEVGFKKHFYLVFQQLVNAPGTDFDFVPIEGGEKFRFFSEGPDPHEIGTVTFLDDENKCIEENLGNSLCEQRLKKHLIEIINNDHVELVAHLSGSMHSKKIFNAEWEKANKMIMHLFRKAPTCNWIAQRPYISNGLDIIKEDLGRSFNDLTDLTSSSGKINPLKWHGNISKLCSIFFFCSLEYPDKGNHYLQASREDIISFIHANFVKETGGQFEKETIAKNMNPKEKKRHDPIIGKKIKSILKDI